MLATLHRQGVKLWGGPSWEEQRRFPHPNVRSFEFSPNERYLVTMSIMPIDLKQGMPGPFTDEDDGNCIVVWELATGKLLRSFPAPADAPEGSTVPGMKWSADDRYVARVTPGQQISVYELPGMGLLEKKSIKIDGVVDFEWCPHNDQETDDAENASKVNGTSKGKKAVKENMLVYWTPEVQDQPARVSVMTVPSRTVLRSKNLYNVADVSSPY